MAGAAAFAAFGVMLLAAGPFGALMGIALAYGAYAIHSAIKQHQEAQREMQDQDGNEGEGAGGHNPGGIGQSTNSLTSAASESRTEPESEVGASTLAAGQKQESKSVHGDLIDDDLKKNEDVDENDEDENAEPTADTRSRVAATTHQLGSTKANNLNASASAETAATVPLGEAQHTSAPPHSNTNSDVACTAPSTTQNNTSAERADGPTTHAGTSSASTSDSTATVTPETATAGASTSHAQT